MTRRRSVACFLLAGMSFACTTTGAPPEPQVPTADGISRRADQLLLDVSQFGARIDSVGKAGIVVYEPDGGDEACTNPPRPNLEPPVINSESLALGLAALGLFNENRAAGRKTPVTKCRPVPERRTQSKGS